MLNDKINNDQIYDLAEQGFSLIPLGSKFIPIPDNKLKDRYGGDIEKANKAWPKTSLVSWKKYQTTIPSDSQIDRWISQYPSANWAIITGPKVVVIDADSKEACDYLDSGVVTRTPWQVRTGRGKHYYYQTNPKLELKNSVNQNLKIDFRGYGGYVVAPGSTHYSGHKYHWEPCESGDDIDCIADLPMLNEQDLSIINGYNVENNGGDCFFDATKITQKATGEPVALGGRDNAAASLVGQYIQQGQSMQEMMPRLVAWNATNIPPMDDLNKPVASIIYKHVTDNPTSIVSALTGMVEPAARYGNTRAVIEEYLAMATRTAFELQAETSTPKRKSKILRIDDWAKIPPTPWVIEGYLVERNMACIYGPTFTGKSYLALDISLHIAHGIPWHGLDIIKPGPVLYVCGEGVFGLRKRVAAWRESHQIEDYTHLYPTDGPISFTDPQMIGGFIQDLNDLIEDVGNPSLIVIDTLARNFGGGDENSSKDMGLFVNTLDQIKDKTDACVIIVHHTTKADPTVIRGSGAFPSSLDTSLQVSSSKTDDGKNALRVVMDKQKDVPIWAPRVFAFAPQDVVAEDGSFEETAILKIIKDPQTDKDNQERLLRQMQKRKPGGDAQKMVLETIQEVAREIIKNKGEGAPLLLDAKDFTARLAAKGVKTNHMSRPRETARKKGWVCNEIKDENGNLHTWDINPEILSL